MTLLTLARMIKVRFFYFLFWSLAGVHVYSLLGIGEVAQTVDTGSTKELEHNNVSNVIKETEV